MWENGEIPFATRPLCSCLPVCVVPSVATLSLTISTGLWLHPLTLLRDADCTSDCAHGWKLSACLLLCLQSYKQAANMHKGSRVGVWSRWGTRGKMSQHNIIVKLNPKYARGAKLRLQVPGGSTCLKMRDASQIKRPDLAKIIVLFTFEANIPKRNIRKSPVGVFFSLLCSSGV